MLLQNPRKVRMIEEMSPIYLNSIKLFGSYDLQLNV
jgi:hypothetical protein